MTYLDHTFRLELMPVPRAVYACSLCGEERVYGYDAKPDPAALKCQNPECRGHNEKVETRKGGTQHVVYGWSWHRFQRIAIGWVGRPSPLPVRTGGI